MPAAAERSKPFLLPQYCKGCGRCIEACARHCIEAGSVIDPATGLLPVLLHLEDCTACGLCLDACPEPYGLQPQSGDFELRDPAVELGPRLSTAPEPEDRPDESLALPETPPLFIKGTYASAIGALLAGCRHFFGYPITPSTEGAELMARLLPKLDGVFLQAVSEVTSPPSRRTSSSPAAVSATATPTRSCSLLPRPRRCSTTRSSRSRWRSPTGIPSWSSATDTSAR
jgi:NAD-dependent dihydropyrimidine dehydrogenase PreA subunit